MPFAKIASGGADEGNPPPRCEMPAEIRVGLVPHGDDIDIAEHLRPLEEYLSYILGTPTTLKAYGSFHALVDDLEAGRLDVGRLAPIVYIDAARRIPGLRLLLTKVENGAVHYASVLVVHRASRITKLSELVHKRVGFVRRSSASGFVFPFARLLQEGLDPESIFSEKRLLGTHSEVIRALTEGRVDAGATFRGALRAAREAGIETGSLRVLSLSRPIPQDALVAGAHISVEAAARIRYAFLGVNNATAAGRKALSRFQEMDGWVPTDDAFYDVARQTTKVVDEALKRIGVAVTPAGDTARAHGETP